MKHRYIVKPDFLSGLSGDGHDWAVYDTQDKEHGTDEEWPIAAFAKHSDALAFRRMKETK